MTVSWEREGSPANQYLDSEGHGATASFPNTCKQGDTSTNTAHTVGLLPPGRPVALQTFYNLQSFLIVTKKRPNPACRHLGTNPLQRSRGFQKGITTALHRGTCTSGTHLKINSPPKAQVHGSGFECDVYHMQELSSKPRGPASLPQGLSSSLTAHTLSQPFGSQIHGVVCACYKGIFFLSF